MAKHTKTSHAAYLASDHWQELRQRHLAEQSWCERCSMPRWLAAIAYDQDLHVHHRHYRTVGAEQWEDLEVLCRRCHDIETHGRSSLRPPKTSICELCGFIHWDPRAALCETCDRVICADWLWEITDSMRVEIAERVRKIRDEKSSRRVKETLS